MATNCLNFWTSSPDISFPIMIETASEFTRFPITIYDGFIRLLITWLIPYAFTSYYPGLILLGKKEDNQWLGYLTPLIALMAVSMCSFVWKSSLARYQSAGN